MNNEQNEKLLNALSKNMAMAIQSLETILPVLDNDDFKNYCSKLNDDYSILFKELQMLAKAGEIKLKLTNAIEKAELWTGIKLKTIMDKSVRKFATMIYIGTNMGIIDVIIALCDFEDAELETIELAKKLKNLEETSSEKLKLYLCY